jgi:protein-S-isoprenylcysteine O-methyltransferase Ste14
MKTKIPPPIVAIISILLTYISKDYLGFFYLHPHLQKTLFILFLVSGILLIFFANREFKILETTVNPMKPKNATNLVSKGVFKFTRNPMYLGLFLILISFAFNFSSLFGIIIYGPLFIFYITIFQIIPEEEAMMELFGESYKEYCSKVRRWI